MFERDLQKEASMNTNTALRSALGIATLVIATSAAANITLYQDPRFGGRAFTADRPIANFDWRRINFNDRASSIVVRNERWEVCTDADFRGHCVVLRPGNYPTLRDLGLDDRISSARSIGRDAHIDRSRYAPVASDASPRYDHEHLYEADVTAVRAVLGPPEQRCWVEREQVVENRGDASVPGAIAGAVIGGILGHQVGKGHGKDAATAGGAIGGAIIGANVGHSAGGQEVTTHDVQKCAALPPDGHVDYWDVTYYFRGQEHHVQMTEPPGPTILVDAQGVPRA
jgi:uncharacterized protein YcfJ